MGRLLLIILIIVAVVLLWKAFGPGSHRQTTGAQKQQLPREVMGPDDDPDFLWKLQKQQHDERKRREQQEKQAKKNRDGEDDAA